MRIAMVCMLSVVIGFVTYTAGAEKGGAMKPALPTYTCYQIMDPITIDGKLSERAWKQAETFTNFRLADGITKPTYATEMRAVWDTKNLYLAFICQDPKIIATMTPRDSPLYAEDCIECFLSTGGDFYRYFEFELSPKNVQMDASVFPTKGRKDKIVDYSWNCKGLQTAVNIVGEGEKQRWTIEIALPFTSIGRNRKAPTVGQTWRANFYRAEYSTHPEEYICWSPMYGEANFHDRDHFGYFVFSKRVQKQRK